MKIALLYPLWTGNYGIFGHFARRSATWPPLNLALLAAIAEQHGHEVSIIDGQEARLSEEQLVERALSLQPDLIGLSAYSPFFHCNTTLAQSIKERDPEMPIAIGGPHITIMKEEAFLPQFDYAFVGEAETSFPEFLNTYQDGGDLSKVKGIIFRRDGETLNTGDAEPISFESAAGVESSGTRGKGYPLDQFPIPARNLLPMHRYKLGSMHGNLHFTSIQTMRGCPWKCIFCASEALKTTRVIMRSPNSIVQEMKSVVDEFGIRHFYIVDDVMTLWKDHILEICDHIENNNLKITFEGSTRANLVEDKLFARLAECGLIRISYGLETVDSEMRKTMNKKVPLEAYTEANRIGNKYGIEVQNTVMIGLPGETRETVRNTLRWLREAREVKQATFSIAMPYPGTEFADMAEAGSFGIELQSKDLAEYRRYGSAVTKVGDLTPQDLIELQNEGFVSIFSVPWRWYPVWKKHGVLGLLLQLLRLVRMWRRKVMKAAKPVRVHPNMD